MSQYVTRSLSRGTRFESEYNDSKDFSAFSDNKVVHVVRNVIRLSGSSFHDYEGINTREYDSFRQGVEISQEAYRFLGVNPKLWSGYIKGNTTVRTLGQETGFVETEGSLAFVDKEKIDPVAYIQTSGSDTFRTNLTELPKGTKIAKVESIPSYNSGSGLHIYGIKGELEDGNRTNSYLNGINSQIRQFVNVKESADHPPYNDVSSRNFSFEGIETPYLQIVVTNSLERVYLPLIGDYTDRTGNFSFGLNLTNTGSFGSINPPQRLSPYRYANFGTTYAKFDQGINLSLTGSTDVLIASSSSPVSVELLFKPYSGINKLMGLIFHGNTSDLGWGLFYNGDTNKLAYYAGDFLAEQLISTNSTSVIKEQWNHVAMTRNSESIVRIYSNGELVLDSQADPNSLSFVNPSHKYFICLDYETNSGFMDMAQIRVTQEVLSESEIQATAARLTTSYPFLNTVSFEPTRNDLNASIGTIRPFDDKGIDTLTGQITNSSIQQAVVSASSMNLDNDIREQYGMKSATAGTDVYGPSQGQYGTDSITYSGFYRGS